MPIHRHCTAIFLSGLLAAGCASTQNESAQTAAVQVMVMASTTGLTLIQEPYAGLTVKVGDFDGTNDSFSWPTEALGPSDRLRALDDCLRRLRIIVSVPDARITSSPHFVRSGAIQCFESSGLPAYVTAHQPDASDFEVELYTGNLNDHVAPDPGSRLVETGGPYLGARLRIHANSAAPVVSDVTQCKDQAAASGIFTSTRTNMTPESNGTQMSWGTTTIQPMVDRFGQCLRSRGYGVASAKT